MSSTLHDQKTIDETDARLLLALNDRPTATTVSLVELLGLSRNTVQARLSRLESGGALADFEHRVEPSALGYPLTAFLVTRVTQRELHNVSAHLAAVPEVLQVDGISGDVDLLVHVVAADADDLYRIADLILGIPGVERTSTSLVMRELVPYRVTPLLQRIAAGTNDRHSQGRPS